MKKQNKSDWQLKELEDFFNSATLPTEPLKLNVVCHITNLRAFIDSHLDILKANNGKETFLPYLNRLHQLKEWVETGGGRP
ncbi:MAG: DUF6965 family protein [Bacteroidales bacterium]